MSDWQYSDEELSAYFSNSERGQETEEPKARTGKRFSNPDVAIAVKAVSVLAIGGLLGVLLIGLYLFSLRDELPPLTEIENPDFQLATIAYTADGEELARYARQNRAWVTYDQISQHVIDALVSTEDHRFYDHWGVDMIGTMAIPLNILRGEARGASSISQQLARNLYNSRIGRRVTVDRKLKEMVTAVQLERRYTKPEIIEMYLNTVEFGYNAWGIETASRTFFGKDPADLDVLESATLVGMLKGITLYNPFRNPENSRRRRNIVLGQMVKRDVLDAAFLEENKEEPVSASYHSYDLTSSLAPYFAEHVRGWMNRWTGENGYDLYEDGLVVYTTIDSRMQKFAEDALKHQLDCLQKVVDFQWSRRSESVWSLTSCDYTEQTGYEPFDYFWSSQPSLLDQLVRETARFRRARGRGEDPQHLLTTLRSDQPFMDSLMTTKTRLEAGLVAMDPQTGYVRAWIGGRDLATDWFDHVDKAARQPGSTFKPFVYTAAIDNGWSPYYTLMDDSLLYVDPAGNEWRPGNSGEISGQPMTLRDGLALSKNTISARLILEVGAPEVAFIARRMGIRSPLAEVPALALGTSDVTLYEMATAYATLANGGLLNEPTVVSRIEDRQGNVLYEALPAPREALSEETAYTVVDMMRSVIVRGTGRRIRSQFGLTDYDLAGKTGTTQKSADGWFMMMHPDLVTGSWVGFNDRRFTFRTDWWGQGAHNALLVVGDFFKRMGDSELSLVDVQRRFPTPLVRNEDLIQVDSSDVRSGQGRVGW